MEETERDVSKEYKEFRNEGEMGDAGRKSLHQLQTGKILPLIIQNAIMKSRG